MTISGDCPVEPVEPVEAGCADVPYSATIVIEEVDGNARFETTSDRAGGFRLEVPPGRYRLRPTSPRPGVPPQAQEQLVVVTPQSVTRVAVRYDRGVR